MAKKLIKIGGKLLVTNKLISHQPKPLILKMDTTKQDGGGADDPEDDEVTLHLNSSFNYDFTVDWGDGTTQDVTTSDNITHTYETPGEYIVKIYGVFGGLYVNSSVGRSKYMEVTQWGDLYWESLNNAFNGCENLKITATDVPNWQNVIDAEGCFWDCISLETIPTGLFDDCTEVTTFWACFYGCTSLETLPDGLFDNCTEVTTFVGCFYGCTSLETIPTNLFDNCTEVTSFGSCFSGCASLTSLPTGLFDNNTEVTNFTYCFWNCTSLESLPNGLFGSTEVTDFGHCFRGCTSLETIPTGLFDNCTKVTEFDRCFQNCTSLASIPSGLFDYNTKVTTFRECFDGCTLLDLIGITVKNWSVSNATTMIRMFRTCTGITDIPGIEDWGPFKLYSGSWTGMNDMLLEVTLPTTRYSDMLINFADKAAQFDNTGIYLHGGNSKYNTDGETARDTLTTSYGWNITDGGPE